jgi:hypothetical protein
MARKVGKVGKMSPEIGVKREELLTGGVSSGKKRVPLFYTLGHHGLDIASWRLKATYSTLHHTKAILQKEN